MKSHAFKLVSAVCLASASALGVALPLQAAPSAMQHESSDAAAKKLATMLADMLADGIAR